MDILSVSEQVLFTSVLTVLKDVLVEAVRKRANLCRANLGGADLYGANLCRKKIAKLGVFTGLYKYEVWAVLFEGGERWVRMGCLFYSLEKWEEIGIRNSNLSEFPDDRSDKCEERVAAFEFAKAAVLRLKLESPVPVHKVEANA